MAMNIDAPHTLIFVGAHPDDESFWLGGTLAEYALRGVRVFYACATRGEVGTVDPEHLQGYASPGDMRWAELMAAAKELGLADVFYLGYRDSGMAGSADNTHPSALAAAPLEEATARVVKVFREIRPQVVFTFDPIGGYRHPDHIAIHNATVKAFHAAGDPAQFPELGPAYQPQKLYFSVFPKRFMKLALRLMPLFGQDPRRFGRNKDVDATQLLDEFPIHAAVPISLAARERQERASACHKSQLVGGPFSNKLLRWIGRRMARRETFMRAYPPVPDGRMVKESDLFEGVIGVKRET
jgi:N-acetyl-1-D-myo-inositol-2-amino-2-deoxy-alpha-D-glucopyranoside deacetylase/mycothiol S-conjugate amidase